MAANLSLRNIVFFHFAIHSRGYQYNRDEKIYNEKEDQIYHEHRNQVGYCPEDEPYQIPDERSERHLVGKRYKKNRFKRIFQASS